MRNLEVVQFGETLEAKKTYYVQCGCKTFVFTDTKELTTFLTEYIQNPNEYEKRWYSKQGDPALNMEIPSTATGVRDMGIGEAQSAPMGSMPLSDRLRRR
jgi:hypothetical protein